MAQRIDIDLDALAYIPAIRSRQAELKGYQNVRVGLRAALKPLVSLGKIGRISEASRVAEKITTAVGGPFFLDLNSHAGQQCDEWAALSASDENFNAWRQFAKENVANALPLALLRDGATERAFIRQLVAIENSYGVAAVRSRRPAAELELLKSAIAAVEDVNNLLIILDMGYIRASLEAKEVEASRVISALRTIDASVRIAVISSSFPRALSAYGDNGGSIAIQERELHARLGGDDVAIYGDHAAIHPDPFEPAMARWVPRIDYATADAWTFRRYRDDDGGFYKCAKEIVGLADWDADFTRENWGAARIAEQAQNSNPIKSFGSPSGWISVRVNMHIERQALAGTGYDYDEADEDEE